MDFLDTAQTMMDLQKRFPGTVVDAHNFPGGATLRVDIPITQEFLTIWRQAQQMFEPVE